MTPTQRSQPFQNASESFKRLNPHLFGVGSVPATKPERDHGRLPKSNASAEAVARGLEVGKLVPKHGSKLGRIVIVRLCRRKLETHDNLRTSYKFLVDAIADSILPRLPPGRADEYFDWEYFQEVTDGEQGTIVKIEI